tara:strand:+ start:1287 stop:2129 length:843 start_codon:yes stop_codon:yes gene_type:complete
MNNFNNFNHNSGYVTRHRKKTLILDITDSRGDTHLGTGGKFNIKLFEPLVIDKYSEIYLDSFTTMNSNIVNGSGNGAFLLKIDQFNINSNVASSLHNNHIYKSIVIPNEHVNIANNHTVVMHKAKKFNYVGDIYPTRIGNLTGKITNLHGEPIFHSKNNGNTFTYALIGITSGNLAVDNDQVIRNGHDFTLNVPASANASGTFIVDTFNSATSLHFSTDTDLSNNASFTPSGGGNIIFTVFSPLSYTVTVTNNSPTDNPNLMLISNPARFIAEFTINSVE